MSAPNCNYCKTAGHTKYYCPVLSKKKDFKKSAREAGLRNAVTRTWLRSGGIPQKGCNVFGTKAQMKIDSFRDLEKQKPLGDKSLSESEFNALGDELASQEKEYEAALDFQSYVKNSDICFSPKERNVRHGTQNFYSAIQQQTAGLADISSKLEEMLDSDMTAGGVSIEDTLIRASDHYWDHQYAKGRTVFYGWARMLQLRLVRV